MTTLTESIIEKKFISFALIIVLIHISLWNGFIGGPVYQALLTVIVPGYLLSDIGANFINKDK